MKVLMGAALVSLVFVAGAPAALAATKRVPQAQTREASDVSTRRAHRGYPIYRTFARSENDPVYFARPYYYRPYSYSVPVPFFLGFAYLPNY
jgi:hypothetical protein